MVPSSFTYNTTNSLLSLPTDNSRSLLFPGSCAPLTACTQVGGGGAALWLERCLKRYFRLSFPSFFPQGFLSQVQVSFVTFGRERPSLSHLVTCPHSVCLGKDETWINTVFQCFNSGMVNPDTRQWTIHTARHRAQHLHALESQLKVRDRAGEYKCVFPADSRRW